VFIEAMDDGGGGDNWTTRAIITAVITEENLYNLFLTHGTGTTIASLGLS